MLWHARAGTCQDGATTVARASARIIRVVRHEHRTSPQMDTGQLDGPVRDPWAMFTMNAVTFAVMAPPWPGSVHWTPDLPAPGTGVSLQTVTNQRAHDGRY